MKSLKQRKDKKTGRCMEKYRIIPLHQALRDMYMQYFIEMNLNQKSEDLLFPMRTQVADLHFKKLQNNLGIRIHAHKFRHTLAVETTMDQVPLNVLE